MAYYYTLETVRNQLLQNGGTLSSDFVPRNFPDDWRYCPCAVLQACTRQNRIVCQIYVGVYLHPPRRGIPIIIEVFYERATHKGFVRANHMKLNELINKGKINQSALKLVAKPF